MAPMPHNDMLPVACKFLLMKLIEISGLLVWFRSKFCSFHQNVQNLSQIVHVVADPVGQATNMSKDSAGLAEVLP